MKKVILFVSILSLTTETKPLTTLEFCAYWIGFSYVYRIANKYMNICWSEKQHITPEDVKTVIALLQNNQLDLELCKRRIKALENQLASGSHNSEECPLVQEFVVVTY